jgi:hypothetical protein
MFSFQRNLFGSYTASQAFALPFRAFPEVNFRRITREFRRNFIQLIVVRFVLICFTTSLSIKKLGYILKIEAVLDIP